MAFGFYFSLLHSLLQITELPEFGLLPVLFLLRDSKTKNWHLDPKFGRSVTRRQWSHFISSFLCQLLDVAIGQNKNGFMGLTK